MGRSWVLERMKSKAVTISEFNFEKLQAPPISYLLAPADIEQLRKLATSLRYSGKPLQKMKMMDQIMESRGFRKITGGTNRVVYKHLEFEDIVAKVAIDKVGMSDNPAEFRNQFIFKPFVTKVFETTPCGTVGIFERVIPITSKKMFESVASDVYDMLRLWFLGEYVLGDIGTKCFLNFGIREGFGPVLLDFPYVYKLDGEKLFCNKPIDNMGSICGGVIDYDAGFNGLYCTKCGAKYKAKELEKAITDQEIVVERKEDSKMKVSAFYGDNEILNGLKEFNPKDEVRAIVRRRRVRKQHVGELTVSIKGEKVRVKEAEEAREEKHNMKVEAGYRKTVATQEPIVQAEEKQFNFKVSTNRGTVSKPVEPQEPVVEEPVYSQPDVGTTDEVETTEETTATVIAEGVLQNADECNRNGRFYPKEEEATEEEVPDTLSKYSGLPLGDSGDVCYLKAQSTKMKDIIDSDDESDCIALVTDDEAMWLCDGEGRNYVLESIDGCPVSELAFMQKSIYDEMVSTISTIKKDNAGLIELNSTLREEIEALKSQIRESSKNNFKRDSKGRFTKGSSGQKQRDEIPDQVDEVPVGAAPNKK